MGHDRQVREVPCGHLEVVDRGADHRDDRVARVVVGCKGM